MAIGTLNDFRVNPVYFKAGMLETLGQNGIAFNAATNNTILFSVQRIIGQITNKDFFKRIAGLISDRDPSSTAAVPATKFEQDVQHGIKVDRRIGPVDQTLDSLRKIGETEANISFMLGQQVGEEVSQDYFNAALLSCRSAIRNGGGPNVIDLATQGGAVSLITDHLRQGLAAMGDAANRIAAWVMHSDQWNSLIKDQLDNWKIDTVAGQIIYGATPATFNRPVIVTDSVSLAFQADLGAGLEDVYETLGLVQGAANVVEAEFADPHTEIISGLDNLVWRFQSEYAFNLEIKGASWNEGTGGLSPDNAALGTATNWDNLFTNFKDRAGVVIRNNPAA